VPPWRALILPKADKGSRHISPFIKGPTLNLAKCPSENILNPLNRL